jgi:hypothetical protein
MQDAGPVHVPSLFVTPALSQSHDLQPNASTPVQLRVPGLNTWPRVWFNCIEAPITTTCANIDVGGSDARCPRGSSIFTVSCAGVVAGPNLSTRCTHAPSATSAGTQYWKACMWNLVEVSLATYVNLDIDNSCTRSQPSSCPSALHHATLPGSGPSIQCAHVPPAIGLGIQYRATSMLGLVEVFITVTHDGVNVDSASARSQRCSLPLPVCHASVASEPSPSTQHANVTTAPGVP